MGDRTVDTRASPAWANVLLGAVGGLLSVGVWQAWGVSAQAQNTVATTGMTTGNAEAAVLTCDGGSEDIVLVLDQQGEELMLYVPRGQNSLEFKDRYGLRELFAEARVRTGVSVPMPIAPVPGVGPSGNPTR